MRLRYQIPTLSLPQKRPIPKEKLLPAPVEVRILVPLYVYNVHDNAFPAERHTYHE